MKVSPDLRVITPADLVEDAHSGAMLRRAAVSEATVGAQRLWAGYVELAAGQVSAAHHHGEAESVIYIIEGSARFYSGERLDRVWDAGPGDFVYVPPQIVHVESNLSPSRPVRMVVVRSTQEAIVFNLPYPEGWMH